MAGHLTFAKEWLCKQNNAKNVLCSEYVGRRFSRSCKKGHILGKIKVTNGCYRLSFVVDFLYSWKADMVENIQETGIPDRVKTV